MIPNLRKTFWVLLLLSPGFWWLLTHAGQVVKEWTKAPVYAQQSLTSRMDGSYWLRLREMQWAGQLVHRESLWAKLAYNWPLFFANQFVDYLEFFPPRIFFVSGDGSGFAPPRVEPIPVLLFPFWIWGLVQILERKWFKEIAVYLALVFIAYLIGQKNMAFLWPVMVMNLRWSALGLDSIQSKKLKTWSWLIVGGYSLYVLGGLWLG